MIIYYEQVKALSIGDLKQLIITSSSKKFVKDIKLIDFLESERSLIGVYVFFDLDEKPVYVGKTSSRSILERVAAHYDLRPLGFMNSFLSSLSGNRMSRILPRASDEDLKRAFRMSLDYKLLFIELAHKAQINTLENILSREFEPPLNSIRGKRPYSVADIIEHV